MSADPLFSVQAINPWGRPMHLGYEHAPTGYAAIEQRAAELGTRVRHRDPDTGLQAFDRRGDRAHVFESADSATVEEWVTEPA